jgi:hypothetical protein
MRGVKGSWLRYVAATIAAAVAAALTMPVAAQQSARARHHNFGVLSSAIHPGELVFHS